MSGDVYRRYPATVELTLEQLVWVGALVERHVMSHADDPYADDVHAYAVLLQLERADRKAGDAIRESEMEAFREHGPGVVVAVNEPTF